MSPTAFEAVTFTKPPPSAGVSDFKVVKQSQLYPIKGRCTIQRIDRQSLALLDSIKEGRLINPLLFGSISFVQGWSHILRRGAEYLMAVDERGRPLGVVGYQEDKAGRIVKGIEMVGKEPNVRGLLCEALLEAAAELRPRIVEVNVSAYDARLQRTFYEQGFRPVAYAPAMVFRNTERLDVIKMVKLNERYEPGEMEMTGEAKKVFAIVDKELRKKAKNTHGRDRAK